MAIKRTTKKDSKKKKSIMVVDDLPIVREGILTRINLESDLKMHSQVGDAALALETLSKSNILPDLVIVDLLGGDKNGIELLRNIKLEYHKLKTFVFSECDELIYAERCLKVGAKGYLMKDKTTNELIIAMRKVLEGKIYVSNNVTLEILHRFIGDKSDNGDPITSLTEKELEVFRHIGRGISTRDIANNMGIVGATVGTYIVKIRDKLKIKGILKLRKYAFEHVKSRN